MRAENSYVLLSRFLAIYQLTEFPEYRVIYEPTLQYMLSYVHQQSMAGHSDQHVVAAIEAVLKGKS